MTTVVEGTVVGATVVAVGTVVFGAVVVGATVDGGAAVGGGSEKITPGSPTVVAVNCVCAAGGLVVVVTARATVVPGRVVEVELASGGAGDAFPGKAAALSTVDVVGTKTVTVGPPPAAAVSPVPGAPASRLAALTNATMLTPAATYSSLFTRWARVIPYHQSRSRSAVPGRLNAPRFLMLVPNASHSTLPAG